jgi:hypothetical protein
LWTVVPGLFTYIINAILKVVPDTICPSIGSEDPEDIEKADREYSRLKRTRSVSVSLRNKHTGGMQR